MPQLPKISIVTPAYKSAATIEQTIRSVVAQDYSPFEYIVIDGAGDDTREILSCYNDRLTYWCSEPDNGQYDAIKKGFSRATGEVLCWINADDKLLPNALQIVGDIFSSFPEIDWVSSLLPGSFDAQGYYSGYGSISGFSRSAFLDGFFLPGTRRVGNWVQQESTFFRKSLWDSIDQPFGSCMLAGDFKLWCEFYKISDLVGVTYPLAGFRHICGQRSEDISTYTQEARQALEDLRKFYGHIEGGGIVEKLGRLSRFPQVGRAITKYIGYDGKKIVRERRRFQDAGWSIQEYQFLP